MPSARSTPLPLLPTLQGRGTPINPPNRFQPLDLSPDPDFLDHLQNEPPQNEPPERPAAPQGAPQRTIDPAPYAPQGAPQRPNAPRNAPTFAPAQNEATFHPAPHPAPRPISHPVAIPQTRYFHDPARTIIATNDSPDVSFDASINPYRGCEHGCVYCFARPTHEYLDLSPGLDFETQIFVKTHAPSLLRKELSARSWRPQTLGFSGVTDPYQHIDRKLQLTRRCLEVLADFRNPVAMITKSHAISRDLDLLASLARFGAAMACISITTLDNDLSARMEPRASSPHHRLAAVRALADAGIPVGVLVAPVIPGLTDHEIPAILAAAKDHGATFAAYIPVRLPWAIKDLIEDWLARHFPDRKDKVLNRITDLRGGKLYDSTFHDRMTGQGPFAQYLKNLFDLACRKLNLNARRIKLDASHFRPTGAPGLFDQ